jgi:transcriptional regulator with XRE-family HTH domain
MNILQVKMKYYFIFQKVKFMRNVSELKLSKNIKKLIAIRGITLTNLAKELDMSAATLYRIVNGLTKRPKYSAIVKLASYFHITISELIGESEIEWGKVGGLLNTIFIKGEKLPLCLWEVDENKNLYKTEKCDDILVNTPKDKNNFALKVKNSLISPLFPKGAILICNPTIVAPHNSYVIVLLAKSATMILRKLIIDSNNYYISPANSVLNTVSTALYKLKDKDKIMACVTQVSFNF